MLGCDRDLSTFASSSIFFPMAEEAWRFIIFFMAQGDLTEPALGDLSYRYTFTPLPQPIFLRKGVVGSVTAGELPGVPVTFSSNLFWALAGVLNEDIVFKIKKVVCLLKCYTQAV